ncbi:helix-hairpin-helix domain-containing protein [bacterium]|nr:helix-hairpin-helix domain-containing protein [bacterium]
MLKTIGILLFFIIIIALRISWYIFILKMGQYERMQKDMPATERNTITNMLRAWVRRRDVIKRNRAFVFEEGNLITLKNSAVSLVLDTKNKVMNCVDNKNIHRFATVIWEEQPFYGIEKYDNYFEQTFDNICISFSDKATYYGVLQCLKSNFTFIKETKDERPKPTFHNNEAKPKFIEENKNAVNINQASEQELAKLPGINIVIAKRIVKYRDLHNGFKTKQEFYDEIKLKPHFKEQIDSFISTEVIKKKEDNQESRIVDF